MNNLPDEKDAPGSPEAAVIPRASTEAVRPFRCVYQEMSTRATAGQIEGAAEGTEGSQ